MKSAKWVKNFCLAIKSLIPVELIGNVESHMRGVFVQKSGLRIYRNDTINQHAIGVRRPTTDVHRHTTDGYR